MAEPMKVLVAHPARQHSHRLAQALEGAGMLHSYWTMLPDRRALSWLPHAFDALLPSAVMRHSLDFLPQEKVHVLNGPLIFQKLALRASSAASAQFWEWIACATFDAWVARKLSRLRPDVVVGYEMCCEQTFRAAKALGITCALDAAAVDHTLQDEWLEEGKVSAGTAFGKRLRSRKDEEVALADLIVCVSDLARQSYLARGVEVGRIVVNLPGCDTSQFASDDGQPRAGVPRFVFVGMPNQCKGFDLLLDAYAALLRAGQKAELHVVGDSTMAGEMRVPGQVKFHGKLSHDELAELLPQMDCLVLPSRLDSFGMVVIEALASGIPVIVSDHVGAAMAIREGENGWVVPADDVGALTARMLDCCTEVDALRNMGSACRESALGYDWAAYSGRAIGIFSRLHGGDVQR